MRLVPPFGPSPAPVLVIGEAPGQREAEADPPRPFVGPSGRCQAEIMVRHRLPHPNQCRLANVIQEYTEGNPDPTEEQIERWTPHLVEEIRQCCPQLIIAVGRFAARRLLGDSADLEVVHGMPYRLAAMGDPTDEYWQPMIDLANDFADIGHELAVVCVYHPAYGLRNLAEDPEAMGVVNDDYAQAAAIFRLLESNSSIQYVEDLFAGQEDYRDVTGKDFREELLDISPCLVAIDTEGEISDPWSIQLSYQAGSAVVLRTVQPDFKVGIKGFQQLVSAFGKSLTIGLHDAKTPQGACYDVRVCANVGLDLTPAQWWNTQYWLYCKRTERMGLKIAGERRSGAAMTDYQDLVYGLGKEKQIQWLGEILDLAPWPKPSQRLEIGKNGVAKFKQPKKIEGLIEGILRDVANGKVTAEGPTDPYKRYGKLDREVRRVVESRMREVGLSDRMPTGGLDDVELGMAVRYAARDADITFREMVRQMGETTE